MTRIPTVSPETAPEPLRGVLAQIERQYGFLPGVIRVLLTDPAVGGPAHAIYDHLNLRPDSPLSRVQREMVATVVNGLVGGAP